MQRRNFLKGLLATAALQAIPLDKLLPVSVPDVPGIGRQTMKVTFSRSMFCHGDVIIFDNWQKQFHVTEKENRVFIQEISQQPTAPVEITFQELEQSNPIKVCTIMGELET